MKRFQKTVLLFLLASAIASLLLALRHDTPRWLTTAGILLDLAGIVQLEISGLFERILDEYGDEEKYPYGPPSHITREIIHNPDTPIRSWIFETLFYDKRTGFYFLIVGFATQLAATWA